MRELVKLIEEGAMPEMTPDVQAAVAEVPQSCSPELSFSPLSKPCAKPWCLACPASVLPRS